MVTRQAGLVLTAIVFSALVLAGVLAVGTEEASAATVRSCGGGNVELTRDEERVFELQNRARESRGVRPLCVHPALQKAARSHSAKMIRKDRFFHGNVGKRLKRHGYRWSTYGQNIAYGSGRRGSPESVFNRWMKSRATSSIYSRRASARSASARPPATSRVPRGSSCTPSTSGPGANEALEGPGSRQRPPGLSLA